MRNRTVGVLVIVLAAAGGLFWSIRVGFLRPLPEVDAARIRRGALEITLPVNGVFETQSVDLAFEIPGRLSHVTVREGQQVRRGEVLASLDDAELMAIAQQAEAAAEAAASEAGRADAAVEAARQQAVQADAAYRAAQANLAQLRAGARTAELRQAAAAVDAARSTLEQARKNLTAAEQLFRDGAISRAQLDAARAQYESAQAYYNQAVAQQDALLAGARPEALTAATEQVRQAEAAWRAAQANVRQAQALASAARFNVDQARAAARAAAARAARAHLRAPFDGIVSRVTLNPGAPVTPAIPIVSLVRSAGWVIADVDEADVGRVRRGQMARITADAYPGMRLVGRVTRIADQVDIKLGTRTVRVRIDLDGVAEMRAGTSVDIELVLQIVPESLLAPLAAVIEGENGNSSVYLIRNGTLQRRDVQSAERNEQFVVVRGVQEGDLVAIAEPALLREGVRVRVRSMR